MCGAVLCKKSNASVTDTTNSLLKAMCALLVTNAVFATFLRTTPDNAVIKVLVNDLLTGLLIKRDYSSNGFQASREEKK